MPDKWRPAFCRAAVRLPLCHSAHYDHSEFPLRYVFGEDAGAGVPAAGGMGMGTRSKTRGGSSCCMGGSSYCIGTRSKAARTELLRRYMDIETARVDRVHCPPPRPPRVV